MMMKEKGEKAVTRPQWEYKTETFSSVASKLDEKLNVFGKEGWEIYQVKRTLTPEAMKINNILVNFEQSGLDTALNVNRKYNDGFFDYEVSMKRQKQKDIL